MEDDKIDIDEGSLREELVCQEDVVKISTMTKEELNKYAHSRLGKKLDLTRRINNLRMDVLTLVKNKLKTSTNDTVETDSVCEEKPKEKEARFVYEPQRDRVFEATAMLLKRTDLIPCWIVDKDGKKL
jgi:hypothetical protein